MNMLTPEDLNQIRTLLTENNVVLRDGILADVGEMIEQNVLPRFDEMNERFDRLEGRTDRIESTMVTKDYLDEKLGKLRGEFIAGGHSPNRQFGPRFRDSRPAGGLNQDI
jgi:hypothetical protein